MSISMTIRSQAVVTFDTSGMSLQIWELARAERCLAQSELSNCVLMGGERQRMSQFRVINCQLIPVINKASLRVLIVTLIADSDSDRNLSKIVDRIFARFTGIVLGCIKVPAGMVGTEFSTCYEGDAHE